MIKITLTLDFKTFYKFWKSPWGKMIEHIIQTDKCICWYGEEVDE